MLCLLSTSTITNSKISGVSKWQRKLKAQSKKYSTETQITLRHKTQRHKKHWAQDTETQITLGTRHRDTNNTEAQDTETQITLGTRHRDTNNTGHKTQNEHKQN